MTTVYGCIAYTNRAEMQKIVFENTQVLPKPVRKIAAINFVNGPARASNATRKRRNSYFDPECDQKN
jgi:hypothetical protein